MVWVIVALLLFAGSIAAALLQAGGISAALAVAAVAAAVAGQLLRAHEKRRPEEHGAPAPLDPARAENHER